MPFILFKFLHVFTMFVAVASAVVPEVVLHQVARSNSVPATRVVADYAARIGKLLPVFFIGGAIFGLIAAATGQLDFFKPWLIAAYVVFVIAMVTGATVTGPWAGRMAAAAAASPDNAASPELTATIHEGRALVASAILLSSIVIIIFLMVVKPGNS
jgi:hypothetical protein